MSKSLIIKGLSKSFIVNKEKKCVLNSINVSFPQGTICGLLGNNGAGKTTLIKCVTGLLLPDNGEIRVDDIDILHSANDRKKEISVVLDGGRNLFWYMTVEENLRYFIMLKGQKYKEEYVNQILEQLGLTNLTKTRLHQLSFGMRQRASIAVALAACSNIIFMDEPTNGLDNQFKDELIVLIRSLREQYGCTFIISSHDMRFIEEVCEYCVLIDHGNIIQVGPLETFFQVFNNSKYVIRYEISDKENLHWKDISQWMVFHDEKEQVIHLMWQNKRTINELISLLEKGGLTVCEITCYRDLATIISMMTRAMKGE